MLELREEVNPRLQGVHALVDIQETKTGQAVEALC
jgi:hypothetical protein